MSVRTVCTAEEEQVDACQATEVTNEVEENAEQFTTDDHDEPCIEESNGGSLEPGDATSLRDSLQSVTSGQSPTAIADDVETNRCDEESPKQSPKQSTKDADESTTTTARTKPDQTSTKTGNSRTKNVSKCADKKTWKPAGSVGVQSTQHSKKEAGLSGTSCRGKPNRQGNASVPTRLPPISVSAMGNSDRKRQQAAAREPAGRSSNGFVAGHGAGLNSSTGRLYKCSATACVTVLSQPPDSAQNDDELSSWSADNSNRNRKYCSSTTTRMNGDRLPLVVANNKHLTSEVSIVDGDSLRIVVDGFQVPRQQEVTSGESTDPVSVRIDVAMTTGNGGNRLAGGGRQQRGRQFPLLLARHQPSPTNREVITTRAIGPSFHC